MHSKNSIKETIFHMLYFAGFLIWAIPASGQEMTPNGTDPTEVRTRVDIVLSQLTSLANSDYMGIQFGGDYAFNSWLSVGADIPYAYARFSGTTSTGIGDMGFRLLLASHHPWNSDILRAIAGGIEMHLNTGEADRGTGIGQTILMPHLAASFVLDEALIIVPRIRYLFSVKEDKNEIDELRLQVENIMNFTEGIWIELQPELNFDLRGERQNTLNLSSVIGKMIDQNWGISAFYMSNIYGEPWIDYSTYLSLRYLF